MRLTTIDRDAFVRAVLDDIPTTDYQDLYRKRMQEWGIANLPTVAKALHDKHPELLHREARRCVHYQYVTVIGRKDPNSDPQFVAEMRELKAAWEKQTAMIDTLSAKLRAVIGRCNTLKQAKERLPEFEKYLPQERDGVVLGSLPVVANVVADLTAAGWPKDKPLKAA